MLTQRVLLFPTSLVCMLVVSKRRDCLPLCILWGMNRVTIQSQILLKRKNARLQFLVSLFLCEPRAPSRMSLSPLGNNMDFGRSWLVLVVPWRLADPRVSPFGPPSTPVACAVFTGRTILPLHRTALLHLPEPRLKSPSLKLILGSNPDFSPHYL